MLEKYPQGKTFCGFFVFSFYEQCLSIPWPYKWYLKCHLIFVCKYRKRLLEGKMQGTIKEIFTVIELRSNFSIDIMETDTKTTSICSYLTRPT